MLSEAEKRELAQLEAEEAQAQAMLSQKIPSGLTPQEAQELAQLEAEESEAQRLLQIKVNEGREADLGFINRARYALEPLESNRRALLAEQFGGENVLVGPNKELYLKQFGEIRPVNKEGLSVADLADFAGATPEIAGAGAGAVLGMGAGSIPAAIAGGVAGSAARQGLSALLGTPQVAEVGERAVEAGLSGAFSGVGAGLGKAFKGVAQKGAQTVSKLLPDYKAGKEGLKLADIAMRENIPSPTMGQLVGGRDLDIEKALAPRPLVGREIRKKVESQVNAIKKNISDIVGDFVDVESERMPIGSAIKQKANAAYNLTKKTASDLFNEVSEQGSDLAINAKSFKNALNKELTKGGFFDMKGTPLKYTSRTGLTPDQFKRVQSIFGQVLSDVDGSATDMIGGTIKQGAKGADLTFKSIDTMRKALDANISEGKRLGYDDLVIKKLRDKYLDISTSMLDAKNPELAGKFKVARKLWAQSFDLEDKAEKLAKISDENIVKDMMTSVQKMREYKQTLGDAEVKKAAMSHINDLFAERLGKEGQVGAGQAIKILRQKNELLKEAIGEKNLKRLNDNLFVLDIIGAPVNPSRTAYTQSLMALDLGEIKKSILTMGVKSGREKTRLINMKLNQIANKSPEFAANLANILGSPVQKEGAYGSRRSK